MPAPLRRKRSAPGREAARLAATGAAIAAEAAAGCDDSCPPDCDVARAGRHLAASAQALAEDEGVAEEDSGRGGRVVVLTPASEIKPRPVKWLEEGRIPLGALTILGGREGIGKTLLWAEIAAKVTCGDLPGTYAGQRRGVIVAATEDSWAMTIVPRLMAAGADLDRVFRTNVTTVQSVDSALSLPKDLPALERLVGEREVALVVLDPLLSRLSDELDTHRDAEVRRALEPLVALADRCRVSVVGLIHVNKSGSVDALTGLMGSRAFAAVARAVIYMTLDPDDSEVRLVGTPKNNLGRSDLPIQSCRIEEVVVADTEEGPIRTARLVWTGTRSESIADILEASAETSETRSATAEAKMWLSDYLVSKGGLALRKDILAAGKVEGHSEPSLRRARESLQLRQENVEGAFPRQTNWALRSRVGFPSTHPTSTTDTTGTTEHTLISSMSFLPHSGDSHDSRVKTPRARAREATVAEASSPSDPSPATTSSTVTRPDELTRHSGDELEPADSAPSEWLSAEALAGGADGAAGQP
ncbi:MAG: AAA family ATPase [Candidatus Dormibacteria bacterium]